MKRIGPPSHTLVEAIRIAGSQAAMATICGVSQPSVWRWVHSSKALPAEHVLKVEAATGVSRHELRPDLYPREGVTTGVVALGSDADHGKTSTILDRGARFDA